MRCKNCVLLFMFSALLMLGACGADSGAVAVPLATVEATVVPTETLTATMVPSVVPTEVATALPTAVPTTVPTALATLTSTAVPTAEVTLAPPLRWPEEILYLSGGRLLAVDMAGGSPREVASDVVEFAATADGSRLALVRGAGREVWLVGRDGSGLALLVGGERFLSDLSWAPDGTALVFTLATTAAPFPLTHQTWSAWCGGAEVAIYDLAQQQSLALGQGCQPAFGPDGLRIIFAERPSAALPGFDVIGASNRIVMVNRRGENGWGVARASGELDETAHQGLVVYAPSWAPGNANQIAYQRFLGYQALVDINLTERSSASSTEPTPLEVGAGWGLAPKFAPDGLRMAVVDYNYSDARGFSGYDLWSVRLLDLAQETETFLPSGTLRVAAEAFDVINAATTVAWAPDGSEVAVVLPAGWRTGLDPLEPQFPEAGLGEVWRWQPERGAVQRLAERVDYGSPLLWLPAE